MLAPVVMLFLAQSFTSATKVGLSGKALLFPSETNNSFVRLYPQKPLTLSAFTLCLRFATELQDAREIIFFAYRTIRGDELNVWRESDGTSSVYLTGNGAFFRLAPLSTFRTHLCVMWESSTGLISFFMDGRHSPHKIYRPGHSIQPHGAVLLGQDADTYLGNFDAKQSFVGEITDVNMWDFTMTNAQISALHANLKEQVPRGNVFDWSSVLYEINGNVLEVQDD